MSLRYARFVLLLALALPFGRAEAQPFFDAPWRSFQTAASPEEGNYAVNLTAADLNGDGLADAVVAQNGFAPGLRVMLNEGPAAGTPATLQDEGTLYAIPRGAWAVAAVDLDGDGDLDLAASDSDYNYVGENVVVLLNAGDGTFAAPRSFPAGGPSTGIAAADFDGDGDTDLALANYGGFGSGTTVSVLLNAGNATFGAPRTFEAGDAPNGIAAGDLDGDGDADLAVAHQSAPARITVLFNTGAGAFGPALPFTPFPGAAVPELVLLDPDGDGDPDVLHAGFAEDIAGTSTTEGRLVLLRNDGAGHFATELIPYGLPNQDLARSLAVADLDGDGRDEAFGAQSYEAGFVVFRDNNAGGFRAAEMYASVTRGGDMTGTIAAAAGDLDGDGDPDVLTTSRERRLVAAHENRGDGTFPERPIYGRGGAHTVLDLGDVDGDGDLDAATSHAGASSSDVLVFRNDGAGAFAQSHRASGPYGFALLRDLTGDGRLDLLFTTAPSPPAGTPFDFFTARGRGDGTFDAAVRQPLNACGLAHPGAFDLDADGDLDVVNTEYLACRNVPESGERLFVSLNNGNGTFQPPFTVQAGLFPYNLAAGDFNEDGRLDLATSSAGASAVLLGNGNGTFRPWTALPSGRLGANVLALDLDADGHLDLATLDEFSPDGAAASEAMLSVLLGDGAGGFAETEHPEHPTQDFRDWVAAGDVDADGDPDLLAGGINDAIVFLNDGAGAFAFSGRYGVGDDAFSLHYARLDGDGRADLVALVGHETPAAGSDLGLVVVPGLVEATVVPTEPSRPGAPAAALALSAPAPNPARGAASLTLSLSQRQAVRVEAFDALGRRVAVLHDGVLTAGAYPLAMDAAALAPGLYVVRAVGTSAAVARRVVVGR